MPPEWGGGRLFGASAGFFAKTTVTRKQKVEKSFQRCKVNRFSEGYQRAVTKIRVKWQNNGFSGEKRRFLAQKKSSLLGSIHDLATTVKSCANQKVFFPNNISLFGKKTDFYPKSQSVIAPRWTRKANICPKMTKNAECWPNLGQKS